MNRVKTTTSTTGTGNITVSASAVSGKFVPLSRVSTGRKVVIMIDDEAGPDYELVEATILSATSFSRDKVLEGSAGPGVKINFGPGVKTVYVTTDAGAIPLVGDTPFSDVVPLGGGGSLYMPQTKVAGPLTFTPAPNPIRNSWTYLRLVTDGVNLPTDSGFRDLPGHQGYTNTDNMLHMVQFFHDGTESYRAVNPLYIVAAVATAVTLTGPTGGVVNTASGAFTVGTNGPRSASLVVTPTPVAGVTYNPSSITLPAGNATATFTATPTTTGAKTIAVTNNGGLSNPASITYTVAAAATVPAAPTIGIAVAGDGYVDVAFTHNSDGGSAVIDSTATLSTGETATGTTSPIRVTAANGAARTATVKDRNAVGLSAASAASNSVTPAAAAQMPTVTLSNLANNLALLSAGEYGGGNTGLDSSAGRGNTGAANFAGDFFATFDYTETGGITSIGLSPDTPATGYNGCAFFVSLYADENIYITSNSNNLTTVRAAVAAGPAVRYGLRRIGDTVTVVESTDSGATWAVAYTFPLTSTAPLYPTWFGQAIHKPRATGLA